MFMFYPNSNDNRNHDNHDNDNDDDKKDDNDNSRSLFRTFLKTSWLFWCNRLPTVEGNIWKP